MRHRPSYVPGFGEVMLAGAVILLLVRISWAVRGADEEIQALAGFNATNLRSAQSRFPGVSIAVDATSFSNNDWVEVSCSNLLEPAGNDPVDFFVALYAPADVDVSSVVPIKFKLLDVIDGSATVRCVDLS